jgi:hypothetical protein
MAISYWILPAGPAHPARPKVGHPKRDRAKVKAGRKAARLAR